MANNQKKQVEDIFAETDKGKEPVPQAPLAGQPRNSQPAASQPPAASPAPPVGRIKRSKAPLFVLLVFVVIVLLGVGWLVASGTLFNQNEEVIVNNTSSAVADTAPVNTNTQSVDLPTVNSEAVDTDGDGLTDEEETELGTSLTSKDSDSDGLYDREEVKVYKTNPLKRDTDGDGNSDGNEVANGYNPNGSGPLLNLQSEIENL